MSVYLYAVCDANAEAPSGQGLHGAPLRMLRSAGLAALVSDQEDGRPDLTEDQLWEHEQIVERLMSAHDLLPARFGVSLISDAAVLDFLDGRSGELRDGLRRIAGAVELGIRAAWREEAKDHDEPAPAPRGGVGYLTARVGVQQRARALAGRVDTALRPLSRAGRIRLPGRGNMTMSAAYLVSRDDVALFQARVSGLDEETEDA